MSKLDFKEKNQFYFILSCFLDHTRGSSGERCGGNSDKFLINIFLILKLKIIKNTNIDHERKMFSRLGNGKPF